MLGYPDGTNIMQEKITRDIDKCDGLGVEMADMMINEGALKLLEDAQKVAFKDEMPQRL
jgi:hydroxymethylbilane synthase